MKVRAHIELFAGSRAGPLRGNFRPNHRFTTGNFAIGEVEQNPDQLLTPGDCAERIVNFLPDGLPPLTEGIEWEIYEGPHQPIGRGKVLEFLSS